MKELLFVDHGFHYRTKSTQFIKDILCAGYSVTEFGFDPYTDKVDKFLELNNSNFDVVVLFQIMPEMSLLTNNVHYKQIAFFPMFDGAPPLDNPIWYQYKDCNIINFSKTLHNECKDYGFSSFYIQFFPEPKKINNMGDEKNVFLWQRINSINPKIVDKVIGFENLNKFYHHQVPDPGHDVIEVAEQWKNKVEVSKWFDSKEEMEQHLQKSAVYFAPRHLEGIGMSFLDAMAIGRCVVAPDNPTMNEYITDGENGFLYDLVNPKRIQLKDVRKIQGNTVEYINKGFKKWEKEKKNILDWIESDVTANRNDVLLRKKYENKNFISWIRKLYRFAKKIAKWMIRKI